MIVPDIPPEEQARLKQLKSLDVLDTQPEERFDRLTRMAKRMFSVPIALVSLVDENRQWFKSCVGLSATETSREVSFCGHSILKNEVFIVPNAIDDPRFEDNPLVVNDPNIRFYAGCPLVVNGFKLGTLCIIDQEPRQLEAEDVEVLKDLASMVERELEAVQLATMDDLTGVSNRRGFLELARHSMKVCIREKKPAVLVYLDMDDFKSINDQFGHAEGDAALLAFASHMKEVFRDSDVIARLGGDEFVLLLSGTNKQQTEHVINRFKQTLVNYNRKVKRGYDIAFTCGIVEFSHSKQATIEDLLAEADALMYTIKKSKK